MARYCKMRNEKKDRVLLPGETKDCVCHCGICKKRNLSQNFKYDEYRERFKCPSCGRYIEYLYANKEEKAINKPIMERNRKAFFDRWKNDAQFRAKFFSIKIEEESPDERLSPVAKD